MRLSWLASGAVVTFLALSAPARADDGPAPAASAPVESAAPPTTPTTIEPPSAAPPHHTVWPWVIMGAGVALITTALVFEIASVHDGNVRDDDRVKATAYPTPGDPAATTLFAQADSRDSSATHERTAALLFGTAGFLTVAGSVVLWFVEGGSPSSPSTTSSTPPPAGLNRPRLLPSLGPGYAGGTFGGSF